MNLFGGVDEEKEQGECSSGYRSHLERECRYPLEELIEAHRPGMAPSAITAGLTQSLDGVKCLGALQAVNYPTEGRGEPSDILVERDVLGPGCWVGWNLHS
jgi:hypothetical protein